MRKLYADDLHFIPVDFLEYVEEIGSKTVRAIKEVFGKNNKVYSFEGWKFINSTEKIATLAKKDYSCLFYITQNKNAALREIRALANENKKKIKRVIRKLKDRFSSDVDSFGLVREIELGIKVDEDYDRNIRLLEQLTTIKEEAKKCERKG